MALTSEEKAAQSLGFTMPEGTSFVNGGDDAIRANAVAAIHYARTAGLAETIPTEITSLNNLLEPGDYLIFGNSDAGRLDLASFPEAFSQGKLERTAALVQVRKPKATNFVWQEMRVWDSSEVRIWARQTKRYNSTAEFGEWAEITTTNESRAAKSAVLNLTTPVNGYFDNQTAMNHRVPFKIPVRARRFRLHIAARNDASGVEVNDPQLRLNRPPYIGKHKLDNGAMTGQFAEPPFLASLSTSIPIGPNEWVGEWINTPLEADTDYLLSFSYYNPNKVEIPSGMSGSYIQAATGLVNALDVPGVNYYFKTPFHIWVEIEVSREVRAVGFIGDSLMVGRDSSCPLYQSPAWQMARRERFLPRMHAIAGGRMSQFIADPNGPRWTRYSSLGRCDAVVIEIGSNDFFDLTAGSVETILATMKGRLEELVKLARTHVADDVYFCTVLPRNNQVYPDRVKTALREYNSWLQTLPFGAKGCYDWAGAISDRTGDALDSRFVAEDGVHLNNSGYAAVSGSPLYDHPAPARLAVTELLPLYPDLGLNYRSRLLVSGNCVTLTLNGRAPATGIPAGKFITVPPEVTPQAEIYGFGQSVQADGLQVRTNGDVFIPAIPANSYYKVSVSWAI